MDWIEANQVAILAGIISSGIVVISQVFIVFLGNWIFELTARRHFLKYFFGFRSPDRIFVVSGRVEGLRTKEYAGTILLSALDAEGAVRLTNTLSKLYRKTEVAHSYSSDFPTALFKANILAVGGPKNNSVSKALLHELSKGQLYFEGLDMVTPKARYSLETSVQAGDKNVIIDYGVVVIGHNPFGEKKQSIVVAGCDTSGVYAAARCLERSEEHRRIANAIRKQRWFWNFGNKSRYFVIRTKTIGIVVGDAQLEEVGYL